MEKLYVICRSDLSPGAQVAQSCHALAEFYRFHPKLFESWMMPTQHNIVCLSASQAEMDRLFPVLWDEEVPVARFHEDDMGSELTALAVGEAGARLLSHLPLTGKPIRSVGTHTAGQTSSSSQSPR